jgi:hypothetical protein
MEVGLRASTVNRLLHNASDLPLPSAVENNNGTTGALGRSSSPRADERGQRGRLDWPEKTAAKKVGFEKRANKYVQT